ncbi:MAG: hypothetical protein IKO42_08455 [Opitutales bacterium]|nr:hypothetical protein [Opitutales bacterium]
MKLHKILAFFAASFFCAASFADVLILSAPENRGAMLRGAAAAKSASAPEADYELRVQSVEIFSEGVEKLKSLENKKDLPTLRLSLFDDVSFDIKISKLKTNSLGIFSVSGSIAGSENSYAVITVLKNGKMTANIYDAEKNYNYKIVCDVASSAQSVIESDVAKMPNLPCGVAIPGEGGAK